MKDSTFLPIGTLLSRQYKILQHIGAGGFGKTYLVEDQLGEKKVVKEFFISSMCTRDVTTQSVTVSVAENRQSFQEQLEKFKEEAHRIYSLSHPNIVKVSALFDENDTAYYVMNYVEGESLAQKSKKGKLSESQIMRYLDQLLSALDYIHSRGITHLDIKPGNIMIDHNDNVVLIDFGASKLFNAQSVNKTMMTSMRPPFTPGYAPIEQENGNVKDMGPHCDIYALGATLYYLYTGEKAPSPFDIFQNGLPPIPQASPSMQKVIKGAMEFDKNRRIKNVAEFRGILSGKTQIPQPIVDLDNTQMEEMQPSKNEAETQIAPSVKSVGQNESPLSQDSDNADFVEKEGEINTLTAKDKKNNFDWNFAAIAFIGVIGVLFTMFFLNSNDFEGKENVINSSEIEYRNDSIIIPDAWLSYKMVFVEGGTFKMGANHRKAEQPIHSVTLNDYYIGETEVTQALWEAVMGSNPSYFEERTRPVEQVSWNDCQEFITKLNQLTGKNFRLPSEAEWEYAARGGNKSRGYKYSGSNSIGDVAWYADNSSSSTHPVGTKSPNELGLYDMTGNVWEWCSDWYGSYSTSSQTNPIGPTTGSDRVLHGGCWMYNAQDCRVAGRDHFNPGRCSLNGGFRLACGL